MFAKLDTLIVKTSITLCRVPSIRVHAVRVQVAGVGFTGVRASEGIRTIRDVIVSLIYRFMMHILHYTHDKPIETIPTKYTFISLTRKKHFSALYKFTQNIARVLTTSDPAGIDNIL